MSWIYWSPARRQATSCVYDNFSLVSQAWWHMITPVIIGWINGVLFVQNHFLIQSWWNKLNQVKYDSKHNNVNSRARHERKMLFKHKSVSAILIRVWDISTPLSIFTAKIWYISHALEYDEPPCGSAVQLHVGQTFRTNPTMHQSHIIQYTVLQHKCVWDIYLVHCGIWEMDLFHASNSFVDWVPIYRHPCSQTNWHTTRTLSWRSLKND